MIFQLKSSSVEALGCADVHRDPLIDAVDDLPEIHPQWNVVLHPR